MSTSDDNVETAVTAVPTQGEALRFWAWLGCVSFGGPAGQIAVMNQELVERRRWVSERDFLHALNYCLLLPGPEAQQLATYLGRKLHGITGGLIAGTLFILPGFVLLLLLSWISLVYGDVPLVSAILRGLQPAVLGIIVAALWRLGKRTLKHRAALLLSIAALVALSCGVSFPLILPIAAVVGWWFAIPSAGHRTEDHLTESTEADSTVPLSKRPLFESFAVAVVWGLLTIGSWGLLRLAFGSEHLVLQIARVCTQAALVTFGGAYAVLPYVSEQAAGYGWTTAEYLVTGLALGETTPGPLILVITYLTFTAGYRQAVWGSSAISGIGCGILGTWFTFLPSFALILIGAPWIDRLREQRGVTAALNGVSAAVVGVIAHLGLTLFPAVWWPQLHLTVAPLGKLLSQLLTTHAMELSRPDWWAVILTPLCGYLLIGRKWSIPQTLFLCAAFGILRATIG